MGSEMCIRDRARAEEREKNIGWIKRLFTAWRVSHAERAERRAEREETGEDDSEEDEPVEIPPSAVTMHPKGTPAPASAVEVQVFEERVDLSNDMYDLAANGRSGRQKSRPCARRAR